MWSQFDGKPYTRAEFKAMVDAIPDAKLKWCKFVTLHHAAAPSIAQWNSGYPVAQRIRNMQAYYEHQMGWGSGPHSFVPPDPNICHWGFTPFTVRGVHASCFNSASIGLEMVGNFYTEEFHSGPGAIVRDHTVFILAVLHRKMGLRPDGFELGKSGLHFHTDCKRDGKVCPGPKVTKEWMVKAVLAEMERQEAEEQAPAPDATPIDPTLVTSFVQPAADGPAGYDPSAVPVGPTKAPALKTAATSKTIWAQLGAIVMVGLSFIADLVNGLLEALQDIVKDAGDSISSMETIVGWFRGNWAKYALFAAAACIIVAIVRHLDVKRIFLAQNDPNLAPGADPSNMEQK